MDDANVSIQNMANDAGNTAAMSQGVGVLADSFSVFQAGMAAVGLGGEDMMKVYAKMMILQQGFNSLTQITNALQSESVLMLKLKAIWQKAVLVFTQQQAAAAVAENIAEEANAGIVAQTGDKIKEVIKDKITSKLAETAVDEAQTVAVGAQTVAENVNTVAKKKNIVSTRSRSRNGWTSSSRRRCNYYKLDFSRIT